MHSINPETINSRIENGYNFNFGAYLSDGFNVFTKQWLNFSLFTLVSFLMAVVSTITIIGPMVIALASIIGFGVVADKVQKNEPISFNDFFRGFDNLGQLIILALIQLSMIIVLYIPIIVFSVLSIGSAKSDWGLSPITSLLILIYYPIMYIGLYAILGSLFFSVYLIHYGGYGAVEAVKTSFKLFKKNWLMLMLFIFIMNMVGGVGILLCVIGVLASYSLIGISYFMAAKDIVLTTEISEIDQIGKHDYTN